MSNRRFSNKAIAKIQIILGLAISLLFGMTSCERKDLYLRVDQTQITIEMYDINLDVIWDLNWQTDFQYAWDVTSTEFGTIGYTKPELVKTVIYNVDSHTGQRYSSFFKILDPDGGGRISLTAGSTYDMMFYNFGTEYISFSSSDDYKSFSASTRMSTQASWIRTRAESDNSDMPDTTKSYIDYNQPDELFGTLATGLHINEDPTEYEKVVDEYGNITYIYRVDAALRPYTFIYMYQIIILNNKDEQGNNRIVGAKGLTATGLAQGVDLFTRKTFSNTISITSEDVKPMQNHDNVYLANGDSVANADILASRMVTWGLPGISPLDELNQEGEYVDVNDKNFLGIGLTLRNGYTKNVTIDITDQMHARKNVAGGIITVYIDANESVKQEDLDRKPSQNGGGFNASVQDWANEVNAEVTI